MNNSKKDHPKILSIRKIKRIAIEPTKYNKIISIKNNENKLHEALRTFSNLKLNLQNSRDISPKSKDLNFGLHKRPSVIKTKLSRASSSKLSHIQENSHLSIAKLLEQISIDLGVTFSITLAKKIILKCVQVLSTDAINKMLLNLGSKVAAHAVASSVAKMLATGIINELAKSALTMASAALTAANGLLFMFAVISLIYDVIDPHGYQNMLNKIEVSAFVTEANRSFKNIIFNSLPIGGEFPPQIYPGMYISESQLHEKKTNSLGGNVLEQTTKFLEFTAEYIKALDGKINEFGKKINLSDSANLNIPQIPSSPTEWNGVLSSGFSSSLPLNARFQSKVKKLNKIAFPILALCVLGCTI